MLRATTAYVTNAYTGALSVTVSGDCRTMTIRLDGYAGYERVQFPTWSQTNGQDDLVWYEAKKQSDGSWICTVDLSRHHTAGTYSIHAYGIQNGQRTMLRATTAYVAKA